jgi:hypothetical protein
MVYHTDLEGMDITVNYAYEPGEEEVWTESNGDPGTPGCPSTVEVINVFTLLLDANNKNVPINIMSILEMDNFSSYIEDLEEEILEYHER